MKLHLNFRFDLRELNEADLTERLQIVEELRAQLGTNPRWNDPIIVSRGPIRHPWFYRLLSVGSENNSLFSLAVAACIASHPKAHGWITKFDRGASVFLLNCELLDLQDEIERRLKQRRGTRP
jgi:hypothetical protein